MQINKYCKLPYMVIDTLDRYKYKYEQIYVFSCALWVKHRKLFISYILKIASTVKNKFNISFKHIDNTNLYMYHMAVLPVDVRGYDYVSSGSHCLMFVPVIYPLLNANTDVRAQIDISKMLDGMIIQPVHKYVLVVNRFVQIFHRGIFTNINQHWVYGMDR